MEQKIERNWNSISNLKLKIYFQEQNEKILTLKLIQIYIIFYFIFDPFDEINIELQITFNNYLGPRE